MAELIIAAYPSEAEAAMARDALIALQLDVGSLPVDVVTIRRRGTGEIVVAQTVRKETGKPLGDGRWGMLIAALFLDERSPKAAEGRGLVTLFRNAGVSSGFLRDVSRALADGGAAVGMPVLEFDAEQAVARLSRLPAAGRIFRTRIDAGVEIELKSHLKKLPTPVPVQSR